MIGFTIALPLSITVYLFLHRGELYSTAMYQRVGFLYAPYNRSAPWWAIHDVVLKMLLTGMLIYVPEEERAAIAALLCVIATANLNYFRPHKSLILFWLSQLSFLITTSKYIVAMVLSLIDQDTSTNASDRIHTIGTVLIILDVCFISVSFGTLIAAGVLLRRKMKKNGNGSKQLLTNNTSHIVPVVVAPLANKVDHPDIRKDHEREVEALMIQYDTHSQDRRQNIEVERVRSHRKTMLRLAQRRKLKESKKMRSVQVFKQLDEKSLSIIVDAMKLRVFSPGKTIVEQGTLAESFFIIIKGTCIVRRKTLIDMVHGQVIGTLSIFDHFGEGALLTATRRYFFEMRGESGEAEIEKRNASVIAKDRVETMMLTGEDLKNLLRENSIDVRVLMRACAEKHEKREAISKISHNLQRLELSVNLRESRSGERQLLESMDTS